MNNRFIPLATFLTTKEIEDSIRLWKQGMEARVYHIPSGTGFPSSVQEKALAYSLPIDIDVLSLSNAGLFNLDVISNNILESWYSGYAYVAPEEELYINFVSSEEETDILHAIFAEE